MKKIKHSFIDERLLKLNVKVLFLNRISDSGMGELHTQRKVRQ